MTDASNILAWGIALSLLPYLNEWLYRVLNLYNLKFNVENTKIITKKNVYN